MDFNNEVFGNIHRRKIRLKRRLHGVQRELDWRGIEALSWLERSLHKEYDEIMRQEDCFGTRNLEKIGFGLETAIPSSFTLKL